MTKVESTPIAPEEVQEKMRDDIKALLSNDIHCPIARAIEKALADIDLAIAAHKPK
ncbi:hypothetical protein N6H05_23940 [Sphingobium sp. WTD-1]|uniref:hypothetical protein n=1 Tax=Sphingobium sp. WTD-1 TaxID=2979467 RepID=UPI0024DEA9E2|nr:hypothetical protein [Sphingobium sp. WTD-1]WIA56032.1 hypothetical protein N6H05_23940 [Sphingobium sp. WTD-1]